METCRTFQELIIVDRHPKLTWRGLKPEKLLSLQYPEASTIARSVVGHWNGNGGSIFHANQQASPEISGLPCQQNPALS